jgi:hypothetical protein
MGDYHKLEVWKLGSELSDRVAVLVGRLPARIRADKGDQLARAADAIHENIESDHDLIPLSRRICAMLAKFIVTVDPPTAPVPRRRQPTARPPLADSHSALTDSREL